MESASTEATWYKDGWSKHLQDLGFVNNPIASLQHQRLVKVQAFGGSIIDARTGRPAPKPISIVDHPHAFTAVDQCPSCMDIAIHWLDEPYRDTPAWDRYERDRSSFEKRWIEWHEHPIGAPIKVLSDGTEIHAFGGKPAEPKPPGLPMDETRFEIMRTCRSCNFRWGNA